MVLAFDAERVWANARQASTEDLLDRVTVYRPGMEPEALEILESVLHARGVGAEQVEAHARQRAGVVLLAPDGTARKCSLCHRPAVLERWGWHWLLGLVPVFPRRFAYCDRHAAGVDRTDSLEEMPGG